MSCFFFDLSVFCRCLNWFNILFILVIFECGRGCDFLFFCSLDNVLVSWFSGINFCLIVIFNVNSNRIKVVKNSFVIKVKKVRFWVSLVVLKGVIIRYWFFWIGMIIGVSVVCLVVGIIEVCFVWRCFVK